MRRYECKTWYLPQWNMQLIGVTSHGKLERASLLVSQLTCSSSLDLSWYGMQNCWSSTVSNWTSQNQVSEWYMYKSKCRLMIFTITASSLLPTSRLFIYHENELQQTFRLKIGVSLSLSMLVSCLPHHLLMCSVECKF